jgi:hypothetical protein
MTAKEMAQVLDKVATIRGAGEYSMTFDVRITDAKDGGWGRTLYEVEPVAGDGGAWVNSESVWNIRDSS